MYPMLKFDTTENKFIKVINKDLKIFESVSLKNNPYCSYPFNALTINPDGKIMVCCADFWGYLNLGNILKDEIQEILNNENRKRLQEQFTKNKLSVCKECYVLHQIDPDYFSYVQKQLSEIEAKTKQKIKFFFSETISL
ncbi:MAG: SPASM domain-containing protein [Candidatus Calescibacterium sp.]|nr:SPASM domain-containing protein [Candidatus Calescibacterium sp.]MDW8133003.1 SPASM domain-containing protein [Candidatus Calescibacterium sp.]